MKTKHILKRNENNEQKKNKKSLTKFNTEYNKNKTNLNLNSFVSKKNIKPKLKEEKNEKEEITKNKSNVNIINNNKSLRMKKNLTNLNDKINHKIKINHIDTNKKNRPFVHRKSINYNNVNKNTKNITKQLYINDIIPNNNKICLNHIKNSFMRANNFNTYHTSPHKKGKYSNLTSNSHSQKNKNYKNIMHPNLNEKNSKIMKKINTQLNKYNNINCKRNSCKSNKNIKNLNNYKNNSNLSSSADKQKNYSSLLMRANLNNSTNQGNLTLLNKINYEIYKKVNMLKLDYDLENNISEINYTIGNLNSNDFALCNSNSSLEEIYSKLLVLCKEKGLTLAKIESNKFICKKDGDNSIKIEINKRGKTNVLKLYYLNGKEAITKEIIKEIIMRIGF